MKYLINRIIVVEGKEDVSYLSSFIDAEYVSLNGYDMPQEEIDYLNKASSKKEILVIVDPDEAGRAIEERLKKKLDKATYLHIDISKCNKGKKFGVAECDKNEIFKVLNPYIENGQKQNITRVLNQKISKIDISDKFLKDYICHKFTLGKCNTKKLITRLNTLGISEEEISAAIKEYKNGN